MPTAKKVTKKPVSKTTAKKVTPVTKKATPITTNKTTTGDSGLSNAAIM